MAVGVKVAVAVAVGVWVAVAVGVNVAVAVAVGVKVAVAVGVGEGEGGTVAVAVGVGDGVTPPVIVTRPLAWVMSYEIRLSSMKMNSLAWGHIIGAHAKGDEPEMFVVD